MHNQSLGWKVQTPQGLLPRVYATYKAANSRAERINQAHGAVIAGVVAA